MAIATLPGVVVAHDGMYWKLQELHRCCDHNFAWPLSQAAVPEYNCVSSPLAAEGNPDIQAIMGITYTMSAVEEADTASMNSLFEMLAVL